MAAASPMDGQVRNLWIPQSNSCGIPITKQIPSAKVAVTLTRSYTISLHFKCSFQQGRACVWKSGSGPEADRVACALGLPQPQHSECLTTET